MYVPLLARCTAPMVFVGQGGKVPQLVLDPGTPHQLFSKDMLTMSDEEIDALLRDFAGRQSRLTREL